MLPQLNSKLKKNASLVSFNSGMVDGIQHNGGVHDTVIMDEMIDKNGTSQLYQDTSQYMMEEFTLD